MPGQVWSLHSLGTCLSNTLVWLGLSLFFQPPVDHSDSHVLPAGDRFAERFRLHPVQTGSELSGEDHLKKEAPRTHYIQVW